MRARQKNNRHSLSGKAAFTLVETAIVLLIIGIVTGGLLKAEEMLNNARITKTIQQIHSYSAALAAFKDVYSALPGDLYAATSRLPGCTGVCIDGDGDNIVGQPSINWSHDDQSDLDEEPTQFWQHLAFAGMITGVVPLTTPAQQAWGITHPAAPFKGGFHYVYNVETAQNRIPGHHLVLRGPVTGDPHPAFGQAPMSPHYTALLDRKMDDGNGQTGTVYADDNHQRCWRRPSGIYRESRQALECIVGVRLSGD